MSRSLYSALFHVFSLHIKIFFSLISKNLFIYINCFTISSTLKKKIILATIYWSAWLIWSKQYIFIFAESDIYQKSKNAMQKSNS